MFLPTDALSSSPRLSRPPLSSQPSLPSSSRPSRPDRSCKLKPPSPLHPRRSRSLLPNRGSTPSTRRRGRCSGSRRSATTVSVERSSELWKGRCPRGSGPPAPSGTTLTDSSIPSPTRSLRSRPTSDTSPSGSSSFLSLHSSALLRPPPPSTCLYSATTPTSTTFSRTFPLLVHPSSLRFLPPLVTPLLFLIAILSSVSILLFPPDSLL
jgi:hypothetical protein